MAPAQRISTDQLGGFVKAWKVAMTGFAQVATDSRNSLTGLTVVEEAFGAHDASRLLEGLRASGSDFYLVGGAVRDHFMDATVNDLDIAVPNGDRVAHKLLAALASGAQNRHGNWRFDFPNGQHIDLIEPQNFYQNFAGLEPMLKFFDASVNALAVDLRSGEIIDPVGGFGDLHRGQTTLPSDRWTSMSDFESVHLTLRALRLLRRHPLRLTNPELLAAQLPKLDLVEWHDLYRLNRITRDEAKRTLFEVCDTALVA